MQSIESKSATCMSGAATSFTSLWASGDASHGLRGTPVGLAFWPQAKREKRSASEILKEDLKKSSFELLRLLTERALRRCLLDGLAKRRNVTMRKQEAPSRLSLSTWIRALSWLPFRGFLGMQHETTRVPAAPRSSTDSKVSSCRGSRHFDGVDSQYSKCLHTVAS